MQNAGVRPSSYGLDKQGIQNPDVVYWNLGTAQLIEKALTHREGLLASGGPLVVRTGDYTGRAAYDKFIVRDASTESTINWGPTNQPILPRRFDSLFNKLLHYLQTRDLYVQDCFSGVEKRHQIPIRVITELAWHNLFARQLFVRPDPLLTDRHVPEYALIHAPGFRADPEEDGTNSSAFVVIHFTRKLVIIGGTAYAGEMKKAIFSVLNYIMPPLGILPMHCSANIGPRGDTALFFGLSGTGKTTLSADPERRLIGDDEHGWTASGVFNFEGGCYAKCIRLSKEHEPQIWQAIRFGTVLENVAIDTELRLLDLDDGRLTENTRASYPLAFVENAVIPSIGGLPQSVVFLTCDAFGVLPPLARLTPAQAMYHYLSGYTAKVGSTEVGLGKEPEAAFSACFGAPFLPRSPDVYAEMLGEKLNTHHAQCWLVNTGWTGGPYGVGRRMSLPDTRSLVRAALSGALDHVEYRDDPIFRLAAPKTCPGVDPKLLDPRATWADSSAYDRTAAALVGRFRKNFERFHPSDEIKAAGPVGV